MQPLRQLAAIISEVKENEEWKDTLTLTTSLIDEVGLDSLQLIQLMLRVEEQFKIQMDFERFDYDHLQSVQAFLSFLESLGANLTEANQHA
ncbi:acyl carrier protein [Paenibacillus sp. 1001270B_150601_E10]|uniref:acyl carrier protein n=1 Tax=Paenibacillus sp. 1001270B_150601_E10 TaxID=2787079 RepID=UPI00189F32A1|nr:acyl carrier protein [Paenibacillus sp. 1001270B_150601_E10]